MAGIRDSRRHSTTRFSESVVVAETSYKLKVKSSRILISGEVSTSFNKDNSANFSGEKKCNEAFRGVYFLTVGEKT